MLDEALVAFNQETKDTRETGTVLEALKKKAAKAMYLSKRAREDADNIPTHPNQEEYVKLQFITRFSSILYKSIKVHHLAKQKDPRVESLIAETEEYNAKKYNEIIKWHEVQTKVYKASVKLYKALVEELLEKDK